MDKITVARSSFVAALGLTGFKFAVGLTTGSLGIISEAVHSLLDVLVKAAKKYRSQALEADAIHFTSDIFSSLVVLAGLICYSYGIQSADSLASIVVAVIVLMVGWKLGRRSVDVLVDRTPGGARETVEWVINAMPEILSI